MTLREFLDSIHNMERELDNELIIHLSSPSIGPIANTGIKSTRSGFDWENGKTILEPKERLVVKTDKEDLYDMSYDLLHFLWVDAFQRKRKPWYFDRLKRIYERAGSLKIMTEIAEREAARLK